MESFFLALTAVAMLGTVVGVVMLLLKGRRKVGLLTIVGSFVAFGVGAGGMERSAQDAGFIDMADQSSAKEAGYTDAGEWSKVRDHLRSASAEREIRSSHANAGQENMPSQPNTMSLSSQDEGVIAERIQAFGKLYEELQAFKSEPLFLENGFSVGSRYNAWYSRVQDEHSDPTQAQAVISRLEYAFSDLVVLGRRYWRVGKIDEVEIIRATEAKIEANLMAHGYVLKAAKSEP